MDRSIAEDETSTFKRLNLTNQSFFMRSFSTHTYAHGDLIDLDRCFKCTMIYIKVELCYIHVIQGPALHA